MSHLMASKDPELIYCSCLLQASTQQPNNTSRWYYCSVVATITPLWCRMEVLWELSKAPDNVNFHPKKGHRSGSFGWMIRGMSSDFQCCLFKCSINGGHPFTVCRWEDWHHTFVVAVHIFQFSETARSVKGQKRIQPHTFRPPPSDAFKICLILLHPKHTMTLSLFNQFPLPNDLAISAPYTC